MSKMNELLKLLNYNNIKFLISDYAGNESIVIKKNNYKIEIYEHKKILVSDLQKVPYTWGRMGSTTLNDILDDLKSYLNIYIDNVQLSLFDL